MSAFEVLSLDPAVPQIRAPGVGDTYSVPRDMTMASGTTLSAQALSATAVTLSGGNLTFSSTAQRITGDMSNGTIANRVAFQNSVTNTQTAVVALPNGTSTQSQFMAFGANDGVNTNVGVLINTGSEVGIRSNITGTGTYVPLTFNTGGSERVRIDTSGNVGIGTASINTFYNKTLLIGGAASVSLNFRSTNTGTANSDGTDIGILNSGTSDFFIVQREAANVIFEVNGTERMRIDSSGNVVINTAAIATTATDGFLYVPTCAGTPTGTPTTYTGRAPIVVDTTNNKLYFYSGGQWRDAGP